MNFKESRPIYLQIADRLMDEIAHGVYAEGARVPSVREYAAMVEVNANTVVRSFDWLQQHNVIFNRRGIGYFVADGACSTVRDLHLQEFETNELPELFRRMEALNLTLADISRLYDEYENQNYKNINQQ